MTPEEKAMTEKSLQSGPSEGPKIPLREDTFHLADAQPATENEKEVKKEEKKPEIPKEPEKPTAPTEPSDMDGIANQAIAKVIDDKLLKLSKVDLLTISVNKTGLFVGIGIILILIWLVPLINYGLIKVSGGDFSLKSFSSDNVFGLSQKIENKDECPVESPKMRVRVKTNNDSLSQVNVLREKLVGAGFDLVETVYDETITTSGVMIAVKNDDLAVREKVIASLGSDYQVSSEAASLTNDSDFEVAILVGEEKTTKSKD